MFLTLNLIIIITIDAASFCHMIISFCKKLNWPFLATALSPYAVRLGFGVQEELIPLVRIGPEIPAFRARAFYRNGIRRPEDILTAGKDKVLEILVGIIPFESDDPLCASSSINSSGSSDGGHIRGGGSNNPSSSTTSTSIGKERWRLSCDSLALSIVKNAHAYIQEELESLETIKKITESI
jgi:hypothetical protein